MFRYIFSAPFWAIPNNFVLHIFSVPLCASSLSIYISLDLQCPIMCKFSNFFHFVISLVSHFGQVPYLFTFHQIFSVPLCASSPFFSISLYLQCPILGKFPIYLHSIRCVPFWASSLSIYIPLDLQCPIWGKFPIYLHSIRSSVSHYVQVLHLFTFHYIFCVPFWASTLQLYVSLFLQCPIMCQFSIFLHFILYLVSNYVEVPKLLMFRYIFSVPFWASTLQFYVSLYLQCPIMCKFSIFLHFILYLVSHFVQVP